MISFDVRDLEQWAGTLEARGDLPALVRRLILATTDRTEGTQLRFPSGSSIDLRGWDGRVNVSDGNTWVPVGRSRWEVSCERRVESKAQSDYEKRSSELDPEVAKEIEFVFVTPRRWDRKQKWVKDRRREGEWADVSVIDADDLIAWLDDAPGVAVWFADKVNKSVDGVAALDLFWEQWSSATSLQITTELVVAGRAREQERVGQWINDSAGLISIKADTKPEAIAFIAACAYAQYEEWGSEVLTNAVIVENLDAWRRLEQLTSPMILIRAFDAEWSPRSATDRGHSVAVVLDTRQPTRESVTTLPRLGRAEAIPALQEMGLSESAARSLIRQTARRLVFVRLRLTKDSSYTAPDWCSMAEPEQVAILTLIGKWDGDNDGSYSFLNESGELVTHKGELGEGDISVIERITGTSYEKVENAVIALSSQPAQPFTRVGNRWHVDSREEAWYLVGSRLNSQQTRRFKDEAIRVLSALSPALEMDADQRYMAAVIGRNPAHSDVLRDGIVTTLALMAAQPDGCPVAETDRLAREVVSAVLSQVSDWRVWASLGRLLPRLAEIAPDEFLDALERALASEREPLAALFGESGNGVLAPNHYAQVLWSLDLLSWSADYFGRVALLLARLVEAAPLVLVDGPARHLEELFVPDLRFTDSTDEERLHTLERLLAQYPDVGWKVLVSAATRAHRSMVHRYPPDWRPWGQDADFRASGREIREYVNQTYELLLDNLDGDIGHWLDLLRFEVYVKLPAAVSEAMADRLLSAVDDLSTLPSSPDLRDKLRRLLHKNRKHRDAPWSMDPSILNKFEDAYSLLAPEDPAEACAWLFGPSPAIPNPTSTGDAEARWRLDNEQVRTAQREAISDIWENEGPDGITTLIGRVIEPAALGLVCAEVLDFEPMLELSAPHFASPSEDTRSFAKGVLRKLASMKGWEALDPCLEMARESKEPLAVCDVYLAADSDRAAWEYLSYEDTTVQTEYWRKVNRHLVSIDGESDAEYLVSNFLLAERSWDLVLLRDSEALPSKEIINILRQLPQDTIPIGSELGWAAFEIAKLLAVLDADDSISDEAIAGLEFPFIILLEHHRSDLAVSRLIAGNAAYFAEFISAAYLRDDDSADDDARDTVTQNRAILANTVLDKFDALPGVNGEDSIDHEALSSWVSEARRLCREHGRGEIGDTKIGELLSGCPADPDGLWPCTAVRDQLDFTSSTSMANGFSLGKLNREGVTLRSLDDGGEQERENRDGLLADAEKVRATHPFTAKVLRQIAESYEGRARYQDSEAEWRDLSL